MGKEQVTHVLFWTCLVLFTVFFLFPIFWIITLAFKGEADILSMPPAWIFRPVLDNFKELFESQPYHRYILNSTLISSTSVVISLILGVPAAYSLSRLKFRYKHSLAFGLLATRMAPPITFAMPFFLIFKHMKLLDTHIALIIVYMTFNLSWVVWMMWSFFDEVPAEIEEAAAIDGCSRFRTFLSVSLPLVGPGLAATAVLCWVLAWSDFMYALVLTRRVAKTAPVAITIFMRFEEIRWGTIAAGGVTVMVPVLLFAIIVRKYLVRGLAMGAIKG